MTPHKQLFDHDPDAGIYGDCFRTAIACLLDVEPAEVPHRHDAISGAEQDQLVNAWLRERGLFLVNFAYHGRGEYALTQAEALEYACALHPGVHHLFMGQSGNGWDHVVVARDGEIVHDPSRNDCGIVGPCSDGYWWINFIGKLT